jgi:hypothetical protein
MGTPGQDAATRKAREGKREKRQAAARGRLDASADVAVSVEPTGIDAVIPLPDLSPAVRRALAELPALDRNAGELEWHYLRMARQSIELRERALAADSHTAVVGHQKAVSTAMSEYWSARRARIDEEERKANATDLEENLVNQLRALPPVRRARVIARCGGPA